MKHLSFLLLLSVFWGACAKQSTGDYTEDPVFTLTYAADGIIPGTIEAGNDGYYLFTRFAKDNQGVMVAAGSFALTNCPTGDCPNSVTFEFRNLVLDSLVNPVELFHLGNHAYRSGGSSLTTVYRTVLRANPTGHTDFTWNLNNGPDINNGTDTISFDSVSPGPQRIRLTSTGPGLPVSRIERTIFPLQPALNTPWVNILVTPDSAISGYYLQAVSNIASPIIQWSTGSSDSLLFEPDSFLADTYTVTVTDPVLQLSATATLEELTPTNNVVQTTGFEFFVVPINISDTLGLGTVAVQWVDSQGVVWRSDGGVQDQTATFTVLETEAYIPNENGEKTWKMRVGFGCRLYNDAGEFIEFSGEGVIGVAYP